MKKLLASLSTAVRWHRRGLAAVAAAVAVLSVLSVFAPTDPDGVAVVVTTQAVPAGTTVTADQVRLATLPRQSLPEFAVTSIDQVVGQVSVVSLTPGTMLTSTFVVSARVKTSDDRVLVPVRLAEPAITGLLRVGDLITLVGLDTQGRSVIVAKSARVAALTAPEAEQGPLSAPGSSTGLVVVETDPDTGAALAVAAGAGDLSVMLG